MHFRSVWSRQNIEKGAIVRSDTMIGLFGDHYIIISNTSSESPVRLQFRNIIVVMHPRINLPSTRGHPKLVLRVVLEMYVIKETYNNDKEAAESTIKSLVPFSR